ncbi:MAG TPA: alpha/beta hydrolase fold domain-containing protein [Candidatus Binataceae bacterium]|nr:alpha/beta hydrolase fold domain-containing protein [Candidatus Binataceae bacterium]
MGNRGLELAIELSRMARRTRRPTVVELGRLAELRAEYEELAEGNRLPGGVNREAVVAGGISAEWVSGAAPSGGGVVLYLHGGCYGMGSVESHRELMTRIAIAASMRAIGINYRLAPANPFPAAVEDASAAYRWLLEEGIEAHRIVIAGDSAGAGLAIAATIKMRDEGVALPAALVCISPWVDLAVMGESMESKAAEDPIVSRAMLSEWAKLYLGKNDARTPLASPLYAELRGLPPMMIQVGSAEVLLDDAKGLAERASAAGVETRLEVWPEMIHVWHSFAAVMAEGREAIEGIGRFVRERVGRDSR